MRLPAVAQAVPLLAVGLALAAGRDARAAPPEKRVAIASFADPGAGSPRGALLADEAADRLALAPRWAVIDREHVREVERGLGWSGSDGDADRLAVLGRKLHADLVIWGRLEGATARARAIHTAEGRSDEIEVRSEGPRPDRMAAALLRPLAAKYGLAPSEMMQRAMDASGDGDDRAWASYAPARERYYAGDFAGAATGLSEALERDPKLGRARALLAMARLKLKDLPAATREAKQALVDAPSSREALLAVARADDWADRAAAAIDRYTAVLAAAPHDAVAHGNLARIHDRRREHAAARREYEAAIEDEPGWTLPRFNLALALIDPSSGISVARATEAATVLEGLSQEAPERFEFATYHARALRYAGRAAAAAIVARKVVEALPADAGARSELALALAEAGQTDPALRALEGGAPGPWLATVRAQILAAKGDLAGALAALAPDPKLDAAPARERRLHLKTLAWVLLKLGRAAEAVEILRGMVDEEPLDADSHYQLGLAEAALKDPAAAKAFERALALAPDLAPAALALGRLRIESGDPGAAITALRAAIAAGASDARLRLGLGIALWRGGELDEAIGELRAAGESAPADRSSGSLESGTAAAQSDARYDLAEALLAAGRRDQAREAAARYLTLEQRPDREAWRRRATAIAR